MNWARYVPEEPELHPETPGPGQERHPCALTGLQERTAQCQASCLPRTKLCTRSLHFQQDAPRALAFGDLHFLTPLPQVPEVDSDHKNPAPAPDGGKVGRKYLTWLSHLSEEPKFQCAT